RDMDRQDRGTGRVRTRMRSLIMGMRRLRMRMGMGVRGGVATRAPERPTRKRAPAPPVQRTANPAPVPPTTSSAGRRRPLWARTLLLPNAGVSMWMMMMMMGIR
ncbi:hypothetical protein BDZ97DRAFT_1846931, partial [Flammula alnicola]